jgi:hypothetical protein
MRESGESSAGHDHETTGRAKDYPFTKSRPAPPPLTDHTKSRPAPPPLTDHTKSRPAPPPLTDHTKSRSPDLPTAITKIGARQ